MEFSSSSSLVLLIHCGIIACLEEKKKTMKMEIKNLVFLLTIPCSICFVLYSQSHFSFTYGWNREVWLEWAGLVRAFGMGMLKDWEIELLCVGILRDLWMKTLQMFLMKQYRHKLYFRTLQMFQNHLRSTNQFKVP